MRTLDNVIVDLLEIINGLEDDKPFSETEEISVSAHDLKNICETWLTMYQHIRYVSCIDMESYSEHDQILLEDCINDAKHNVSYFSRRDW